MKLPQNFRGGDLLTGLQLSLVANNPSGLCDKKIIIKNTN